MLSHRNAGIKNPDPQLEAELKEKEAKDAQAAIDNATEAAKAIMTKAASSTKEKRGK